MPRFQGSSSFHLVVRYVLRTVYRVPMCTCRGGRLRVGSVTNVPSELVRSKVAGPCVRESRLHVISKVVITSIIAIQSIESPSSPVSLSIRIDCRLLHVLDTSHPSHPSPGASAPTPSFAPPPTSPSHVGPIAGAAQRSPRAIVIYAALESMGVIRKKTGGRGSEGGVKYICDVCSVDITSTVSRAEPCPAPSFPYLPQPPQAPR